MTPPVADNYPSGDLFDLASALAAELAGAEVEVVAAELANPAKLVIVAEGAGITPASFGQEDLRIIHCAADVARHLSVAAVLRLARRALQAEHFWNPNGPISFGCQWSNETLAMLAERYPPSETAVWQNARHLLSLRRRWDAAEDLLCQFRMMLSDRDDFGARAPSAVERQPVRTPTIANAPARRKRGAA